MVAKQKKPKPNSSLWGLFGGSFDPVHAGHVTTALSVAQQLNLEKVLCLSAARSPFKKSSFVEDEHRAAMLQLAIIGHEKLELDTRELLRPPPSYTVDTIVELAKQFPERRWVLILGADAWDGFQGWRKPERILQLAHIAVMTRPGYAHHADHALGFVIEKPRQLTAYKTGKVIYVEVPKVDVSSTKIRNRIARGQSVADYLVPEVETYIKEHKLYQ